MSAALPAAPLVETVSAPAIETLPPEARELYLRGWCTAPEASVFLGYPLHRHVDRKGNERWDASESIYRRLRAYRSRQVKERRGALRDVNVRPGPDELVGYLSFQWNVDTRWLVAEKYPEAAPW